jgi:hypothetical protein
VTSLSITSATGPSGSGIVPTIGLNEKTPRSERSRGNHISVVRTGLTASQDCAVPDLATTLPGMLSHTVERRQLSGQTRQHSARCQAPADRVGGGPPLRAPGTEVPNQSATKNSSPHPRSGTPT